MTAREAASVLRHLPTPMPEPGGRSYECFCGDAFENREELINHNVQAHAWDEGDSRRAVMEKYPDA